MTVHIQHLTSIARYFESDSDSYGAPYQWVGTLLWHSPTVVEVEGVMDAPTPRAWREIVQAVKPLGAKEIIFKRIRNGQEKTHTVRL